MTLNLDRRGRRGRGDRAHGGAAAGPRLRLPGRHAARSSGSGCRSSRTRARRSAPRYADGGPVGGRGHPAVFALLRQQAADDRRGRDRHDWPTRRSRSGSTPSATRAARPNMDWLDHDRLGFNYRLSDIACALGLAQLERLDEMLAGARTGGRAATARRWPDIEGCSCRARDRRRPARLVRVRRPAAARASTATAWCARSASCGVPSKPYFPAIHLMSYYRETFGHREGEFPVCEDVAARSIALPFFPQMTRGSGRSASPRRCGAVLGARVGIARADVALLRAAATRRLHGAERLDRVRLAAGPVRRRSSRARTRRCSRRAGSSPTTERDELHRGARPGRGASCADGSFAVRRAATRTSTWRSSGGSTEIAGARRRQAPHRPLAQRPGRDRRGDVRRATRRSTRSRAIETLAATLLDPAEAHLDWPMPGYTHLQRAQPVYLGHHLLAYVWMLLRDRERFARRARRDRRAAARRRRARRRQLRHRPRAGRRASSASRASPRTRSTRSPTATSCSTTWPPRPPARRTCRGSAPRSCCGPARSSASARSPTPGRRARRSCPRRRTPTRPSCCAPRRRGSPRTWSALHGVMHGLPLTYNKDMQEDKEHLFDAVDTLELCLAAADGMLGTITLPARAAGRRRPATSSSPPPTSPTCWSGAGCRSARRTASSAGWCGTAVEQRHAAVGADARRSCAEPRRCSTRELLRGARRRRVARVEGLRGRHQPRARCASSSPRAPGRRSARAQVKPAFYDRPVLEVARDLIGCVVSHGGQLRGDRRDRGLPRLRAGLPRVRRADAADDDAVRPARAGIRVPLLRDPRDAERGLRARGRRRRGADPGARAARGDRADAASGAGCERLESCARGRASSPRRSGSSSSTTAATSSAGRS